MNKTGVLLINLGTPDRCSPWAVYRYLTQFLNDKRVIDLPTLPRWILTNLVIVPFRYKKSLAAYQKIWTAEGSPLLIHSRQFKDALQTVLGTDYQVELAMRYRTPSIAAALNHLADCPRLIVLPLFPQYSSAATGSAIENLLNHLSKRWNIPELHIIRDFYNNPGFINAYASLIKRTLSGSKPDLFLFSYHGLHISEKTQSCYRAQCYATSALIASELGLSETSYQVSFQSRLGRTPWIQPYTDILLKNLAAQSVQHIAIVCPSFIADCLETLEEVDLKLREQWYKYGGKTFTFIPCLNQEPEWVKAAASMITI